MQYRIFLVAVAAIVLHIADDELLQPQPGTSARDHLLAAFVPIAVALLGALAYPRLRPGFRAAIALVFGLLALVAGMIAVGGARAEGLSGSGWTGLLLLPAGAALIGLAVWVPWRERGRWAATRRRLWLNRGVAARRRAVASILRGRSGRRRTVDDPQVPHADRDVLGSAPGRELPDGDGLELSGLVRPVAGTAPRS